MIIIAVILKMQNLVVFPVFNRLKKTLLLAMNSKISEFEYQIIIINN